jgi:hypothetical protein
MQNTHAYCPVCEAIRPVVYDEMDGTDVSGKFVSPTDIVCTECKFIIATTYRLPSGSADSSGNH